MPKVLSDYGAAVALLEEVAVDLRKLRPTEVLAAVTHWLQAQGQTPPYCDARLVERWRIALQSNTAHDDGQKEDRPNIRPPLELNVSTTSIPFPPPTKDEFTFSDLFAGIGGFRLALQGLGGRCVFACEWDKSAKVTYFRNFGIVPYGDIKQFTSQEISDDEIDKLIPYHDILTAGFPCQSFSLAGMPARNHYRIETGLNGSQGGAFFDLMRIARVKKPRALFLENVRNILSIDHGNTFSTIKQSIEEELGYEFHYAVIDSSAMVPQRRKRLYIVAFREASSQFEFPEFGNRPLPLRSILQDEVPRKYTISDKLWASHIMRSERNRARGTGFTVKVANVEEPSPTLVARYGKDGKECLIPQDGRNPRKLTPLECARLQGFPDSFVRADSDTASYRQFGNSVPVPVIERIGENIIKTLCKQTAAEGVAENGSFDGQRRYRLL
ncbi:MAG TPA: DNA cytosine methyltransferase [Dehalococcoidia bacterium]|nr:DNA cytosine methyltransferase [Dehalococcoidia bacterium]